MRLPILIFSCVFAASALADDQEIMDSWMGLHQSDLIKKWGPPTRYSPDGKGGEVLVYENCRESVSGPFYRGDSMRVNRRCSTKEFHADPVGRLYFWRTSK